MTSKSKKIEDTESSPMENLTKLKHNCSCIGRPCSHEKQWSKRKGNDVQTFQVTSLYIKIHGTVNTVIP